MGLVIFALLVIISVIRWRIYRDQSIRQQADPAKIKIEHIDQMEDGSQFEQYIQHLLEEVGFRDVYRTTQTRDFGADIVFLDHFSNYTVIQVKRYAVHCRVGLSAVQEVYAAMNYYGAVKSIVLTSSYYTDACKILASVNGVRLLDREHLIRIIQLFKSGHSREIIQMLEQQPHPKRSPFQRVVQRQ